MFTVWFRRMFRDNVKIEDMDRINDILEVKSMLTVIADDIMKRGIEKGIEKGKEKGKYEEQIQIARKLLKDGIPVEKISGYTGLDKEINFLNDNM